MSDLIPTRYEITKKDVNKDRLLKTTAISLPIVLSVLPAMAFFIMGILFGTAPPVTAFYFFLSIISLIVGLIGGGIGSAFTLMYRSKWLGQLREKVAIDGIKASEVKWFTKELKTEEKNALKEIKSKNLLLADAYEETLASRLTATRIVKSTGQELLLAKRRKNKLKYLKSEKVNDFKAEIDRDISNLSNIKTEAKEMLVEAESRLQMIEAASRRGRELAGNELALKKLSARTEQLPLALESVKMEEELRKEFVEDLEEEFAKKDNEEIELLED
ncbi:MAG: hypothetical protein ACR2MD_04040 [Aridibacter sp.]